MEGLIKFIIFKGKELVLLINHFQIFSFSVSALLSIIFLSLFLTHMFFPAYPLGTAMLDALQVFINDIFLKSKYYWQNKCLEDPS